VDIITNNMKQFKSLSDKRLIIEAEVNGKKGFFLIDTGASVGLIAEDKVKKFDIVRGRKYPGSLVGAGGEMEDVYYCNTLVRFGGKDIPQFLITDISGVRNSIERETGIEILGIIGLSQMKITSMQVDANDNMIIIE
jgi:retroviral aspartyl protease